MIPKLNQLGSNQCRISMGHCVFWFSYETCVAFESYQANIKMRREKAFSRTTSKHLSQMGVKDFPAFSDEAFEAHITAAMTAHETR